MNAKIRVFAVTLAALLVWLSIPSANALTFGTCITNNNAANCVTGGQYSVTVTDPAGSNNVLFTFSNAGPIASSITDIYFDDGTLLALSTITNGAGTSFNDPATPGDLPGGNNASPPFVTTQDFSADSTAPTQPNGINPGESMSILFTLQSGQEFQTVLDDLADGDLRIGIHVQAIGATGGSESFVCCGGTPGGVAVTATGVPEPSTLVLFGAGLLAFARRFRSKKN